MVRIKCNNKKCGHEWEYKGLRPDFAYITCPVCHYKTKHIIGKENYLNNNKNKFNK